MNFLKKLASCFTHSKKSLLLGSEDLNLRDSIIRFNRLQWILIDNSKLLTKIPKLPEGIKQVEARNCISLNSKSLRKLFLQFGRNLGLQPNMKCSGVKGNVLMDSHSHHKFSHQIDYSSWLSLSKFFIIEDEFFPTLDAFVNDFGERYDIKVPGKKIPKWFNHQNIESYISFWIGPEFPPIALCAAFHLVLLKDSYANSGNSGSLQDDIIDWVCDVNIFINGHKRPFRPWMIFQHMKCDHLWFYGPPHSQLQKEFGELLQADRNHVGISCEISRWTSELGKFAPVIARMGVHVECICLPQNSVIINDNSQNVDDNSQNVDDNSNDTELAPLLSPFSPSNGSYTNHGRLNRFRRRRTSALSNS